ncbi:MAG: hypothetical protein ACTHMX_09045, partial [Thermomicrobiales bacterium]
KMRTGTGGPLEVSPHPPDDHCDPHPPVTKNPMSQPSTISPNTAPATTAAGAPTASTVAAGRDGLRRVQRAGSSVIR